ncbi:L-rhamnose operon regulatory protein [Erwinia rhapontici]
MTVLHSADFFPTGHFPVAIEPRAPQGVFPEHYHDDFHEIVIVEQGAGIHVFNGQSQPLCSGCVCYVRSHDRHLYEQTENLCLTNVLYRGPESFRFLSGLQHLLPQEQDGNYPSHWRIGNKVLAQARQLIEQLEQPPLSDSLACQAEQEMHFMRLLLLLRQGAAPATTIRTVACVVCWTGWRITTVRMWTGKILPTVFRCRCARSTAS